MIFKKKEIRRTQKERKERITIYFDGCRQVTKKRELCWYDSWKAEPTYLGASGTGRTTFVNTLCDADVLPKKVCDNPEEAHIEEGVAIKPVSVGRVLYRSLFILCNSNSLSTELDEDGVRWVW